MNQPDGSVTLWLELLKAGDATAAQPLWERYCSRLADLARRRLTGSSLTIADEEDVALAAFDSFCRGVADGRFPRLDDRDDLWQLLVMLTSRKAATHRERERRLKRGGGMTRIEMDADDIPDNGPSPEFATDLEDELRRLIRSLNDATLERVAQLRLAGHSVAAIAEMIGTGARTIERKLQVIRAIWTANGGERPT
jgi:DNA-directed RNA polymerase specialized sigma24 family protein